MLGLFKYYTVSKYEKVMILGRYWDIVLGEKCLGLNNVLGRKT